MGVKVVLRDTIPRFLVLPPVRQCVRLEGTQRLEHPLARIAERVIIRLPRPSLAAQAALRVTIRQLLVRLQHATQAVRRVRIPWLEHPLAPAVRRDIISLRQPQLVAYLVLLPSRQAI